MKSNYAMFLVLVLSSSLAMGQQAGIYDLREKGSDEVEPGEGVPVLCEDLESLVAGPIDGQVSSNGNAWSDPVPTGTANVVDDGGNLFIENQNLLENDTFGDIFQVNIDPANIALADDGFTLSMDYSISDLFTQYYFTPIGAAQGFIFTRLGDTDLDGDWDVLETDGNNVGVFFDTGVPIDMAGTITFDVLDLDMDIFVNGVMIYSGGIIGSNGDSDITPPEQLDIIDWESSNNFGTTGVLTVDNVSINGGCVGGCGFALGDINEDGSVDLQDVSPFVQVLTGGLPEVCQADCNEDGSVDLVDVPFFIDILTGG